MKTTLFFSYCSCFTYELIDILIIVLNYQNNSIFKRKKSYKTGLIAVHRMLLKSNNQNKLEKKCLSGQTAELWSNKSSQFFCCCSYNLFLQHFTENCTRSKLKFIFHFLPIQLCSFSSNTNGCIIYVDIMTGEKFSSNQVAISLSFSGQFVNLVVGEGLG